MQKINIRRNIKVSRVSLLAGIFAILVVASFTVAVNTFAIGGGIAIVTPVAEQSLAPTVPMKSSVTSSITNGAGLVGSTTSKSKSVQSQIQSNSVPLIAGSISPQSSAGMSLYVNPSLRQAGRPEAIASQPSAVWFGGWNANIQADVNAVVSNASASGRVASLVAYNIPVRDCGSYSAGGANSSAAYRQWIDGFASGIGARTAIVILEPDALPGIDCLSAAGQTQRLSDLSYAVARLAGTGAITYLDAGNYTWQSVTTMSQRLKSANVAQARGFSLNVSGYGWTDQSVAYGQQLVRAIGGGKGFVLDTSRNGNGPAVGNEWCNPRGRALGASPTTATGIASLDAYLWIKTPGESDGTCNGGPSAGEWWQEIADELINNRR